MFKFNEEFLASFPMSVATNVREYVSVVSKSSKTCVDKSPSDEMLNVLSGSDKEKMMSPFNSESASLACSVRIMVAMGVFSLTMSGSGYSPSNTGSLSFTSKICTNKGTEELREGVPASRTPI